MDLGAHDKGDNSSTALCLHRHTNYRGTSLTTGVFSPIRGDCYFYVLQKRRLF